MEKKKIYNQSKWAISSTIDIHDKSWLLEGTLSDFGINSLNNVLQVSTSWIKERNSAQLYTE